MAKKTRLVREDTYEDMGSSYQCVQVAALDAALRDHGVAEPAVRQKIAEAFLFAMGTFHDNGWFKPSADSAPLFPLLCFSERFLGSETPVDELGQVYAPSSLFAFHEYASGNAALLYEGDPNAEVETGEVSDLGEP